MTKQRIIIFEDLRTYLMDAFAFGDLIAGHPVEGYPSLSCHLNFASFRFYISENWIREMFGDDDVVSLSDPRYRAKVWSYMLKKEKLA